MIRTLYSRVKFPQEVEKLHSHFEWIHCHLRDELFGTEDIDKQTHCDVPAIEYGCAPITLIVNT